jgi:hypothetical protein
MTFRAAVKATPDIAPHYRAGLQALREAHRQMIRTSRPRSLDGSFDLDEALSSIKPNDARWDYGVGLKRRAQDGRAIWIEVHPASSFHVDPVLAKLSWLQNWLANEAPALNGIPARYVWLATGAVALPLNSPKRRIIAARGLDFRARILDLDEFVD